MLQPIRQFHIQVTDAPDGSAEAGQLREGLSAVVQVGRDLWLACDETATLERVSHLGGGRFGQHRTWKLTDFLDLPGGDGEEVDVEGLAWCPPYLWLVGSHGRSRPKPDFDDDTADALETLAKIKTADNRYLLARIPLAQDGRTGEVAPQKSVPDPRDPSRTLTAARLRGDGRESALMEALDKDPHLRRFLKIPGKENGFDVEGLAAADDGRVFLGLRGPVLRGWAVVLELQLRDDGDGLLRLRRIGPGKQRYRKHFLDLDGLGVREITEDGDDLLILAGPTMDVRAPAALFRWRDALKLTAEGETVTGADRLQKLLELPHDVDGGYDHPEGICLVTADDLPTAVLVVYDRASRHRMSRDGVRADVFALD